MSDRRFRMVLRHNKNAGSSPTPPSVRSRRNVAPPKKDDLSILTWKEQQMIEKAQLASLRTSSQNGGPSSSSTSSSRRGRGRPRGRGRGRPPHRKRAADWDDDNSDSSTTTTTNTSRSSSSSSSLSPPAAESCVSAADQQAQASAITVSVSPPPLLLPVSPNFLSKATGFGDLKRASLPRHHHQHQYCPPPSTRRRQSGSRQSFGSLSSLPELLSPGSTVSGGAVAASGASAEANSNSNSGFAARKSAYMGPIGGSSSDDEECDYDGDPLKKQGRRDKRGANSSQALVRRGAGGELGSDEDDGSCSTKHRLPPANKLPSMEDIVDYFVLKATNCVPSHLKYVGNLQWETVIIKKKSTNASVNNTAASGGCPTPLSSPSSGGPKLEQAWAKKAIQRAKKSLTVLKSEKCSESRRSSFAVVPAAPVDSSTSKCCYTPRRPTKRASENPETAVKIHQQQEEKVMKRKKKDKDSDGAKEKIPKLKGGSGRKKAAQKSI